MTVMMKKVNIRKKYHEFNVTDEKNKIWKGSTEKMAYFHCGKTGHTKEKCFKLISNPIHWEDLRNYFKYNETGHMAIYFPKNDKNRN